MTPPILIIIVNSTLKLDMESRFGIKTAELVSFRFESLAARVEMLTRERDSLAEHVR